MLRESKGNMYDFVTHTWNTVKGKCPHGCAYCYMTKWGEQRPFRFDESELKTDLGEGNIIFVGSGCDLWATEIPAEWISRTLEHCGKYGNTYFFQSKNPARIYHYRDDLPGGVICATVESDIWRREFMGDTPLPIDRVSPLVLMRQMGHLIMITIEPIMDFHLTGFLSLIKYCRPNQVNIGANTNPKVELPEPPKEKLQALTDELKKFTDVKIKPNLKRLMGKR